ncbi:hypothetical protein F5Y09DRAFT_324341 [Xylaria sp. FL1042]|nr:hypothetical protein F5Y09DRAFT_324341 [Xylaria sp. FL1042]
MATHNKGPAELCFMVKTTTDEFNPEDRKLIRSHVMKGKNLGKMRPLGSRRHLNSADTRENVTLQLSSSGVSSYGRGNRNASSSRISSSSAPHTERHTGIRVPESIPPRFGSVASTMCLADSTMKPERVEVVLQFSTIAKQLLFPMETCIFFDRRAENWIAPLALDPAFLHASIFASLYLFDAILPQGSSRETHRIMYHYHKTVSILRKRLLFDDDEVRLSNNTVNVVLRLAGHAFSAGDLKSAMNHMQGIQRIVNLRGGLSSFRGNEKLAAEILRSDLGIVMHSGSNPVLFRGVARRDTYYQMYPKLSLFLDKRHSLHSSTAGLFISTSAATHDIELDGQLTLAWSTMSDFCSVINLAADSEQKIDVETFLHSMSSIMYNLLDMNFESCFWKESIRLSLLSFSCSVFLPWRHLGMKYPHLNSILRRHFTKLKESIPSFPPKLVMWLLMACAVTIIDEFDGAWLHRLLREVANLCGIHCWEQLQDMLMSVMWIGIVHDKPGKRVFDAAFGCSNI